MAAGVVEGLTRIGSEREQAVCLSFRALRTGNSAYTDPYYFSLSYGHPNHCPCFLTPTSTVIWPTRPRRNESKTSSLSPTLASAQFNCRGGGSGEPVRVVGAQPLRQRYSTRSSSDAYLCSTSSGERRSSVMASNPSVLSARLPARSAFGSRLKTEQLSADSAPSFSPLILGFRLTRAFTVMSRSLRPVCFTWRISSTS